MNTNISTDRQFEAPSRVDCNYIFAIFDKALSDYPDWFRPYICQDFQDRSIEYFNHGDSVKTRLDTVSNGPMIVHVTKNNEPIASLPLVDESEVKRLATKIFDHMAFGDPLSDINVL